LKIIAEYPCSVGNIYALLTLNVSALLRSCNFDRYCYVDLVETCYGFTMTSYNFYSYTPFVAHVNCNFHCILLIA